MEELWTRLQKVKQHLYFKNPVAPHNPAIANEYRNLGNLQLTAGIEKGDLSTYALDELIHRLENNEFYVEALMELLPQSHRGEQNLETVKKMVLHLISRRINNAASFAGHMGFISKNNTFLYPPREALTAGIKDMIRSGLVTAQELYGIANNNTVVSVIKDAVEDRPAKILALVIEKLETMGECFGQKKPLKAEEIKQSEVLEIKKVKDLMKYLESGRDFIVALTMVIRLIKEGKIKPEKFMTEKEKETLFTEPSKARIAYLDALAMKRINLLAAEAVADMGTGSRLLSDKLILLIDDLLNKKLLDEDKFYSEITPELKQLIMGGHVDLDDSERVTLPGAQASSLAAFYKAPTLQSMPVIIQTPEDIVNATKAKIETAPTHKMPSYRPPAEAVLPRPPDEPDSPEKRGPNKVIMIPGRGQSPVIREQTPVSIKPAKPATTPEPIYPVINHPEKPDHLLMPVAHMKIGNNTFDVPLYGSTNVDGEGYYVYSIGTDQNCDINIAPSQSNSLNSLHCRLRIRQNTAQISAEEGITRIKGQKNTVRGWTEITPGMKLEAGEGAEKVSFTLETPGEVSRESVRDHLETRLAVVEEARRKLIRDFHDEGEEWIQINTLLNELENFDATFKIGCKSPESYRRLRKRTMEPREQFVSQQIARLENIRKQQTIQEIMNEHEEAEKALKAAERDDKIEARRKKENCQTLHIGPKEDPETVPIAWRGWVIGLVDYDDKQRSSMRPMVISSRTFGSHPACTDELVNPERETIKPKYYVKEFMAEIEPHRDDPNKLLINWIGGHVQVMDENGIFGSPRTNPIEVTEGDMVRIGRYDIHIIGKDHAFTPATLLPYAKDLIDQAVERIFESERTTTEQDRHDHENIERLIQLNVASIPGPANGKDESLREYAAKWYQKEFNEIWEKLQLWSTENPVFDSKDFPTLQMLLDLREEPGTFVPDFGIGEKDVKAAAKKRIDRYLVAGAKAYPDHVYHPLNGFRAIGGKIREVFSEKIRKEKQQQSTREKNIADLGLIEIAKFILETDLFSQEDVTLSATDSYTDKIEENIRIRKLFDILEHEYDQSDLVGIIGELRVLCAGKKLSDIFTDEEIAIKDLNLELTLSAEESAEKSYIAQKALFIARRAFNAAQKMAVDFNTDTDDPAGLEEKLNLLDKILSMNLFEPIKLNDDIGNIKDAMQIGETIKKMRAKVEMAKARIIAEAEKAEAYEDSHREYLRVLHQKHMVIIQKAGLVRSTLATAELTVETFEDMTDLCAVVADPVADEIAGKLALEVDYEKHEASIKIRKSGKENDKKCNAGIGRMKTKKYTETWEEIKHKWWKKYEEVGAHIAGLVMSGDERALYLHGLLKHAMDKKYLNTRDIGFTEAELAKGLQKSIEKKVEEKKEKERIQLDQKWKELLNKINQWRTEILAGDDDDFDYLDKEPFFDKESNQLMKERLYQLRGQITATKIGRCLEHVKTDDRAHYFGTVARRAAEKDPHAVNNLNNKEFDLLQYGK